MLSPTILSVVFRRPFEDRVVLSHALYAIFVRCNKNPRKNWNTESMKRSTFLLIFCLFVGGKLDATLWSLLARCLSLFLHPCVCSLKHF